MRLETRGQGTSQTLTVHNLHTSIGWISAEVVAAEQLGPKFMTPEIFPLCMHGEDASLETEDTSGDW